MKAKFINEIKRNIEGSGLGSIGIGAIAMCKAFEISSSVSPSLRQIFPLDSKIWKWAGALEKFPDKMSEILEVPTNRLVHVAENKISVKAEEYLRVQAFSDRRDSPEWPTKYVRKDELELEWKPGESTTMHIYTNELLGVSYVFYMDLMGSRMRFYVFRTPEFY